MLPGLLANEVTTTLREFIITGYETETWPFAGKFRQLVEDQNNGEAFVKGPYVSISLPFSKTSNRLDFSPDSKHSTHPMYIRNGPGNGCVLTAKRPAV